MYKLLVADDEPKIRRGLKKLKWHEIGVEVIGEASNGEEALQIIHQEEPELALIDINMPIMNGLELIQKVNEMNLNCLVIIISGYDEFEYAREAIKQDVFEYILKPVDRVKLFDIVKKAIAKMEKATKQEKLIQWANIQVEQESDQVIGNYFRKWIAGTFNDYEIEQNQDILGLALHQYDLFMIIKLKRLQTEEAVKLDHRLQLFCILNILEETLEDIDIKRIVALESGEFIVFMPKSSLSDRIREQVSHNLKEYLGLKCHIEIVYGDRLQRNFAHYYQVGLEAIREKEQRSPVVDMAMDYIQRHYSDVNLSIEDVAKHARVSTSHLSKQLKKELELSYTEFVTTIRTEAAIKLMKDPLLRIYDISEKVGYSTQHYFSSAFKKVKGVSPAAYRKEMYHE